MHWIQSYSDAEYNLEHSGSQELERYVDIGELEVCRLYSNNAILLTHLPIELKFMLFNIISGLSKPKDPYEIISAEFLFKNDQLVLSLQHSEINENTAIAHWIPDQAFKKLSSLGARFQIEARVLSISLVLSL